MTLRFLGGFGVGGFGLAWFGVAGFGLGVLALVLGEVGVGGLEGVEEEACAAEVDVVVGDTEHDVSDGVLDLGAGVGDGDGEGCLAGAALSEVGDGRAGLVVVVAEAFATHGGTAAATVFGAEVAASAGGGCGLLGYVDGVGQVGNRAGHRVPWVLFLLKIFKTKDLSPDFGDSGLVKVESPAVGRTWVVSLI